MLGQIEPLQKQKIVHLQVSLSGAPEARWGRGAAAHPIIIFLGGQSMFIATPIFLKDLYICGFVKKTSDNNLIKFFSSLSAAGLYYHLNEKTSQRRKIILNE